RLERERLRGPERGRRRRVPREDRERQGPGRRLARGPPHSRETLRTTAAGYGVEVVEVGLRDGVTDPDAWADAIDQDTSAVIFQHPNALGAVEAASARAQAAKAPPAVVTGASAPLPLGILKPPGEGGVDVAVGGAQSLGNRLDFGGPSFGYFAATQ